MPRFLAVLVFQILASTLVGQLRVEPIATTKGGPANAIVYYQGFIYAGCGATLAVYDARSDQSPPYQRRFASHLGSRINELSIRKGKLYVAQHHGGISRWDLARPESPQRDGSFKLQGADHPAYSISLSNDTAIVAFSDRIVVLREKPGVGTGFEFLYSFGELGPDGGRIMAGDVRGAWYACVTGWETSYYRTALFLYNWRSKKRLHFYPRKFGNAMDVAWDEKYQLLHVAGGQHPETGEGLFFSVMVGDRGGLREVYADTIPDGNALKLIRYDGKVWVTTDGGRAGNCKAGQVRLYESTDSVTVRPAGFLKAIKARDIAFGWDHIHVAASNSGVLHVEKNTVFESPCRPSPTPDITMTGAGCTSADRFGDRLVVTAPGYGMGIYDLSYPRRPVPLYHLDQAHSAHKVIFSEDGAYLYVLHKGKGGNWLEVRETESWRQVGRVYGQWGHQEMERYGNRLYLKRAEGKGFDIVDVSRPRQPEKEHSVLMPVNDLQVDAEGRLLVTNEHKVRMWDIRKGAFKDILSFSKWGEGFGEIVGVGEEVVVYQRKKGLVRYKPVKEGSEWTLEVQAATKAPYPNPSKLLSSDRGLLLGYDDHGIFVLHPQKMTRQNHLPTGFGYLDRKGEALRDIVLAKNLLLVVEFFGQVTLVETESN